MTTKPEDVGRWEGDEFVFFEPFTNPTGQTFKRIDFAGFTTPDPSITRDDAVHALINSIHADIEQEYE